MRGTRTVQQAVYGLVTLTLLGGVALTWPGAKPSVADSPPAVADKPIEHARALSVAFRKAAEKAGPTVVTIHSKTKAKAVTGKGKHGANPFEGTPWEQFFNEDFGMQIPHGRQEGTGSGVIIDPSGIILTNNHVVDGADDVEVTLSDGREFKAEDIKTDEQTDLAVLRIKGAGTLSASKFGNSDNLEIGDWVLAIGNPFELDHTVSAGIISGKGRQLTSVPSRASFLQTDAAINPGNSGGPLVDLDGDIVGINTAIATNTGSFNGIGFAVPSNTVKWVVDQLISSGNVQRAYLGIGIRDIPADWSKKLGVRPGQGVFVEEVYPDTPAAAAGMQEQDIVVKFDNTKILNRKQLQEIVERVPIGSKHSVTVLRDGKEENLEIAAKGLSKEMLVQNPKSTRPSGNLPQGESYTDEKLGLELAQASESDLESLGLDATSGVLVTRVASDGPAAEAGIARGMLVTKVGKTPVKTVEEFKTAIGKESLADGILLRVRSRNASSFVLLQE